MTTLHVYFALRNQQAFQRLLDAPTRSHSGHGAPSTSGGKSWTRSSALSSRSNPLFDVNARDALGRTVLHLAASATDAAAPEYVRKLLAHPHINVNLPDKENQWTALHRALYHGNLPTALILLHRPDIDLSLKDYEGYTAFDLYNSTVEGTKPPHSEDAQLGAQLFTWGANRNAALGHGDADDRVLPDQVTLEPVQARPENAHVEERFAPVLVKQVVMSKLHTGVVTAESKHNFLACGLGSGGRLGPGQHTQYSLVFMPQLPQPVASIALGQDHTLALTTSGEVFSWGLNRFAQLGYVLDVPTGGNGRTEEPIQAIPRKIGQLNKKVVFGVAACKTASACWTSTEVYTWGTNSGQLGYDRNAHPVQVLPRVVAKVSQPVLSVVIADNAMACLLESHDVLCLCNDTHFRVTFPAHSFPSEIRTYRPPHAVRSTSIQKITTCDNTFAALSSNGELFTFSLPTESNNLIEGSGNSNGQGKGRESVKPQRVWALRKKFSAVKDVALGADGSIIICTESGHVFVRARTAGKAFKFQRIPYLQRVVRVCANSTGALGALKVEPSVQQIQVIGNLMAADLARVQPYLSSSLNFKDMELPEDTKEEPWTVEQVDPDDQVDSPSIIKDIQDSKTLCRILLAHKTARKAGRDDGPFSSDGTKLGDLHGADVLIHVHSDSVLHPTIPAHRVVLALRSPALADVLAGKRTLKHKLKDVSIKLSFLRQSSPIQVPPRPRAQWTRPTHISITGCHPLTVLILLVYLYTDEVLSVWDWRVADSLRAYATPLSFTAGRVKMELQACAEILELAPLASTLEGAFKREVRGTLARDVLAVCAASSRVESASTSTTGDSEGMGGMRSSSAAYETLDPLTHDAILALADKDVPCHSTILRARSPLFEAFYDAEVWTVNRWGVDGKVRIELGHMRWNVVRYVVMFLYGADREMFDVLESVKSSDELIELMFEIMAVANELLLDRLTLICSSVILRNLAISNASSILVDATHFNSPSLVQSAQRYITQSLETFLESRILDDLPPDVVRGLAAFMRAKQTEKSPLARSGVLVDLAMSKNEEWMALQDFPAPIIPKERHATVLSPLLATRDPKLSPPSTSVRKENGPGEMGVRPRMSSSRLNVSAVGPEGDELFTMDGLDCGEKDKERKDSVDRMEPSTPGKSGWKIASAPRVDMKSIMAEAESTQPASNKVPIRRAGVPLTSSLGASPRAPPAPLPSSSPRPPGAPWKTLATPTIPSGLLYKPPQPISPSVARTPPATPVLKASRPDMEGLQQSPGRTGSSSRSAIQGQQLHASTSASAQKPGMGPVISPSKQTSGKNTNIAGVRRTSSNNPAWTLPPVQPVVQPSSSSGAGMSFVAIQQLQLEQDTTPKKDKRSLIEIQEEEQAQRVEEDFLRWWAAEEERMRMEQEAASRATAKGGKTQRRAKPKQEKKADKGGTTEKNDKVDKGQGGVKDGGARGKGAADGAGRDKAREGGKGGPSRPRTRKQTPVAEAEGKAPQ